MRIDKFLNTCNVVKSRSIAIDMLNEKVVYINEKQAKKANKIKVGDIIKIVFLSQTKTYKILEIPTTNSVKKEDIDIYVKML